MIDDLLREIEDAFGELGLLVFLSAAALAALAAFCLLMVTLALYPFVGVIALIAMAVGIPLLAKKINAKRAAKETGNE